MTAKGYKVVGSEEERSSTPKLGIMKLIILAAVSMFAVVGMGLGKYWSEGGTIFQDEGVLPRDTAVPPPFNGTLTDEFFDYKFGVLHYLKHVQESSGGEVFVLHGMNNKTQSADMWEPNFGMFQQMGNFYVLDVPSFGKSTMKEGLQSVNPANPGDCLYEVMTRNGVLENDKPLYFVAQGWGAEVVMILLRRRPELTNRKLRLIFFSPTPNLRELTDFIKPRLLEVKGIQIWAEKDPIITSSFANTLNKYMPLVEQKIIPRVRSHQPETDMPGAMSELVLGWVRSMEEQETIG